MTTSRLIAFTFFCSSLASSAVYAEGMDIKPGLWEIQHKMAMNGQQMPDMQEMMAQVPPEMREQMKAMMEKNGAGMTDKGMTICITPEQIAKGDVGTQDPENKCKMTDMKQSSNTMTMNIHCDAPKKADGTTTVTRVSNTQWTSKTEMTTAEGQMKMDAKGKWLKADCGNVKPR